MVNKRGWIVFIIFSTIAQVSYSQREFEVKNGGVSIHCKAYGSGKPLLIINGGPGYSSGRLHAVATELSKQFQVILFDQRGTGLSKVSKHDSLTINLKNYLSDIDAIRENLKLKSWVVAGHSFGGLLAQAYAAKFPDRIDKLVLISSPGPNLNFIKTFQENIRYSIGADTIKYVMPDNTGGIDFYFNMVSVNSPAYVYDKSKANAMRTQLTDPTAFTYDVSILMWQDLFRQNFDISSNLRSFKKKTLIIQGAQDIIGMDTAYETHSIVSSSTLVFIRKCGHVPWLDRPVEFYAQLISFLKN